MSKGQTAKEKFQNGSGYWDGVAKLAIDNVDKELNNQRAWLAIAQDQLARRKAHCLKQPVCDGCIFEEVCHSR